MADYNGKRNSDIPVRRNRTNQNTAKTTQRNPYSYDDLMRRSEGQAPVRQQRPTQQNIYVDRKAESPHPQRGSYEQYREDISISSRGRKVNPQPTEYSKGGSGRSPKMPKEKKGEFFRKFMTLLFVAAIVYAGITGYICAVFSNTEYIKTDSSSSSSAGLVSDSRVKNILLLGVDDKQNGNTSRSDTMILLSIDKRNRQLKMTSFLRDTYVEIPGYGENKMNAACTFGGPQLVMKTIEHNFGIDIDNYVLVDFSAFEDIVDSLGGVTVEVEQREAEFINNTTRYTIDYGENVKLTGGEALTYVRIRKLDSDFYRTQRQRKVITAILSSVKKSNPFELIETGKEVMKYVETDMNPLELTLLAEGAVLSYMRYDIVQSRIPVDENYSSQTINGAAVLVIDKYETSQRLQAFIFEKADVEEETTTD
ncbi:MAG: LCP family protein [Clostridia bacterium]|nr:LCP family protein [Clostridia bacterium]